MDRLRLCVAALDPAGCSRWLDSFRKEGWEAKVFDRLDTPCSGRAGIALVEVGSCLCRTPEDLGGFIRERLPLATLVFAAPQSVSGPQIIKFLEAGADDFVPGDIDERVLVAKLKAHVRRAANAASPALSKRSSAGGDVEIYRDKRLVRIKGRPGKCLELTGLTQKELEILSLLVANETRVVSRESMLERLWGADALEVYSNCINKHIETLRKKMGPHGGRIKTVYGAGYMFTGFCQGKLKSNS